MADHAFRWIMTATREEVWRGLPPELREEARVEPERFTGGNASRRWEIALSPEPPLVLGSIRLGCLRVDIRLWGHTPEERDVFLARLEQFSRRGGG